MLNFMYFYIHWARLKENGARNFVLYIYKNLILQYIYNEIFFRNFNLL